MNTAHFDNEADEQHKRREQMLKDFNGREWKIIGGKYEPVGTTVLVLTAAGEVLLARRRTPAESYGKPNTYFREGSAEPLNDPLYWDYV